MVGLVAPDGRSLTHAIELASGSKLGQAAPPVVVGSPDLILLSTLANSTLYVGVALCQDSDAVGRSAVKVKTCQAIF